MKIKASEFHPMRGHMEDGKEIVLSSGKVLTLKSAWMGWKLMDGGQCVCQSNNCYDIAVHIQKMEQTA